MNFPDKVVLPIIGGVFVIRLSRGTQVTEDLQAVPSNEVEQWFVVEHRSAVEGRVKASFAPAFFGERLPVS
ncbi:MAG TPA: hypothetical protein PLK67_15410 [Bryobacteraceae bacterium]|nr:hypothetical protein [Bryobacteraceae bacterium]